MTDIVERIKDAENATHALYNHIFQDAREEIERLRIENEALRAEVIHIKEVEFPRKAQAVADGWRGKCERLEARIEAMEEQEPAAWCATDETGTVVEALGMNQSRRFDTALYLASGAKNVPKAVAYLDLGTGGYMDIGTDLTDEALSALPKGRHMLGIVGTYGVDGYVPAQPAPSFADAYQGAMEEVAIWKKRALEAEDLNRKFVAEINGPMLMGEPVAQPAPSVPDGWLRAIDEALVTAHIGVANAHDTYEQAKAKLDNLIGFFVDVATDPAVNGGWKLMPAVSTYEMDIAGASHCDGYLSMAAAVWDAMFAAAPEVKL